MDNPSVLADATETLGMDAKSLDSEHPEYTQRKKALADIEILYEGGYRFKAVPEKFLIKRAREPKDVYAERCKVATYQNIIKAVIGYYTTAMFRDPVSFLYRDNGAELAAQQADWYTQFGKNCNQGGERLQDFAQDILRDMLCFQKVYILTDMQSFDPSDFRSAAEQKISGQTDPYLVMFKARDAINWDTDEAGNLLWIVFRTVEAQRVFGQDAKIYDKWYYFDRSEFRVYQAEHEEDDSDNSERKAQLVNSGKHALSDFGRVPVRVGEIPGALWLADACYPQLIAHLNQDNTYGWALNMGNLPVPVIKGDFETDPQIGETTYVQVPANGDFKFAESSGVSYDASQKRLDSLREEIYRSCYLMAQGKNTSNTASSQSGESKKADMMPAADVMGGLAVILEGIIANVMRDISDARGDKLVTCAVQGLEQEDEDTTDEIANIQLATDLNVPSDTLEKVLFKRAARKFYRGTTPEEQKQIEKEIEDAPTKSERQAQAQQQASQQFAQSLSSQTGRFIAGREVNALKGDE